jgi:predicted HTH transcriptional regulator
MESESFGAQGNWLRVLADGRLEGDPALLFDHEQIVEEAIAALRDRYEVLSENLRARHAGLVDGVAPERVNALRQAAFDHTRPAVRVAVEERIAQEEERASTILVMRVEPSGSLHTLTNDTTYLRVGDESRKLTAAQRLELSYDRGAAAFEGSATQLTISHLDADQMGSYAGVLGLADHRSMLLARDLLDRRGRVTVAACLLFDHRRSVTTLTRWSGCCATEMPLQVWDRA